MTLLRNPKPSFLHGTSGKPKRPEYERIEYRPGGDTLSALRDLAACETFEQFRALRHSWRLGEPEPGMRPPVRRLAEA